MSRRFGTTDRRRVINWLKDDLVYYKNNIGEETEFGTVINQKLIDGVQERISQLEKVEDRMDKWREVEFGSDD
tara:strand:+ start:902 stop:1120 length:219 start_codon:yes stop_codon:yes gene_type:complete